MPTFFYRAKNKSAEAVEGQVSAQNKGEAVEKISQMGLLPIKVDEEFERDFPTVEMSSIRVKAKELYTFSRQLAGLLKVGVSLLQALEIIQRQITDPHFRNIVSSIAAGIKDGKSFADCLEQYPKIFSYLFVAMVRAGEESGQLRDMLLSVADFQRRQDEIGSKVRTALAYPVIMTVFGVGTIIFILTFVMPQITNLFSGTQIPLPMPTILLLQTSDFLAKAWWAVLLFIFALTTLIQRWITSPGGHAAFSRFQLGLPFFGVFILKIEFSRFCRTLELLLSSGVSILGALKLSIPMLNNDVVKEELQKCHSDLSAGQSLGKSLKESKVVPSILGDLIAMGEEAGSLSESLRDIADSYEQDVNETIKVMTTLLEPIMIIVVGGIIGTIVIAMLLPVFQMDIFSG